MISDFSCRKGGGCPSRPAVPKKKSEGRGHGVRDIFRAVASHPLRSCRATATNPHTTIRRSPTQRRPRHTWQGKSGSSFQLVLRGKRTTKMHCSPGYPSQCTRADHPRSHARYSIDPCDDPFFSTLRSRIVPTSFLAGATPPPQPLLDSSTYRDAFVAGGQLGELSRRAFAVIPIEFP
ncbi:hypothetical protein VTK73DRAFT_8872 [Phialemonium thermophilum]|uniref:Uncharacterized protein n=1 Tax=Phialemonium thermophilum TaxID=223376 RepID=A0ABR3W5L0_9PEZI